MSAPGSTLLDNSSFLIGRTGVAWTVHYDLSREWVENLIKLNSHKLPFEPRGIQGMLKLIYCTIVNFLSLIKIDLGVSFF